MEWLGVSVPMKPHNYWTQDQVTQAIQVEPTVIAKSEAELFTATPISEAKYFKADINEVINQQIHLSDTQRKDL